MVTHSAVSLIICVICVICGYFNLGSMAWLFKNGFGHLGASGEPSISRSKAGWQSAGWRGDTVEFYRCKDLATG